MWRWTRSEGRFRSVRRPASALLVAVALAACGKRADDPTLDHVPADAAVVVRVRSMGELEAAIPLAQFAGRVIQGPFRRPDAPPGEDGLRKDRPFAVSWRREGPVIVAASDSADSAHAMADTWWLKGEALGGGYAAAWTGPKPTLEAIKGGELPDALIAARVDWGRLIDAFDQEINAAMPGIRAGMAMFGGRPADGGWVDYKESLRSLGILDLSFDMGGGKFDLGARLRAKPGSGLEAFAREARGSAHTLAGSLSKEGSILYVETSMDAATIASFPGGAGIVGSLAVPFVPAAVLGDLSREIVGLHDGRAAHVFGHAGGTLFVESVAGVRDGRAFAAFLESDRHADALEGALAAIPWIADPVFERRAFEHGGSQVARLKFGFRDGEVPAPLAGLTTGCCAVTGDLVVSAFGADADARVGALLDRVRSGRLDRPALAARLGSSRHRLGGLALDLGELARALGKEGLPIRLDGIGALTVEARDGVLRVDANAEVHSPVGSGMPGFPR